jgi:tetratricopeptide (TPR) repeat protein
MIRLAPVLAGLLVLGGCASSPPAPRPPAEESALRWNQRGEEAFRRREWAEALAAFERAQRAYASLDRTEEAAGELLNIATVNFQISDFDAARRALDQVWSAGSAVTARLRADAAYRRALVEYDAGVRSAVAAWLARSFELCPDSACSVAGAVANLRARMALADGKLDDAAREAGRALELNRRHAQRIEQANSHRLLAEIALMRADAAQAELQFTQALALDRAAGESRKIARDLLGLARSLMAQGRREAGAEHARRARDVASSSDDEEAVQQAERILGQTGSR